MRSTSSIARLVGLVAALAGCGGGGAASGPPGPGAPGDNRRGDGAATPPAGPADRPLDHDDCTRLLDRYLELEQAELRAHLPPEEVPTEEQVAAIRTRMHEDGMASCIGQPRAPYMCAMAASSKQALRACLEPGASSGR